MTLLVFVVMTILVFVVMTLLVFVVVVVVRLHISKLTFFVFFILVWDFPTGGGHYPYLIF
jgi:hypothetical protein